MMPTVAQSLQRLRLLKPVRKRLAVGLMAMLVTVAIQLAYPKAVAHFIDHVDRQQSYSWYAVFAAAMMLLVVVQSVATALRYYLFESAGHILVASVRERLFSRLIDQPIAFFDQNNIGELTNRLYADVEVLQDSLTMGLAISLRSAFVCVGGLVLLTLLSPMLSIILIVFLPISMFLGRWVGNRIKVLSGLIQDRLAAVGTVAQEQLGNIRLVQSFNQQRFGKCKYNEKIDESLTTTLNCTRYFALFQGGSSLLVYLALLSTLGLGAVLISKNQLTVGELTSFVIYSAMVATSAVALTDFWSEWMRSIGATERIVAIMHAPVAQSSGVAHAVEGRIAFREVSFTYPTRAETPALVRFTASIAQGEKIALVGPSGAGKSTVVNLIMGFYRPDSGALLFDGVDAEACDWAVLRQYMAVVEQEPALFDGTIYDNIAYSKPSASREEVVAAVSQANALDFINRFPAGFNTRVGSRGVQLSGGQRQRIAIARAILREPKILILDEATSALDAISEREVQSALDRLMAGRTTIIIAHRFATLAKADRVLVLEAGQLVQEGTPSTLKSDSDGLYAKMQGFQGELISEPA